ncbi:hypothetical protein VNO77_19513 [Canavalia gladiata]|uniref:Uncharacterized protein n=1 Tax=Canavalia gladiata TaxID=3824 RepID=A0AAN9LMV4_CANGL
MARRIRGRVHGCMGKEGKTLSKAEPLRCLQKARSKTSLFYLYKKEGLTSPKSAPSRHPKYADAMIEPPSPERNVILSSMLGDELDMGGLGEFQHTESKSGYEPLQEWSLPTFEGV